jgi:hypothetical protein
MEGSKKGQAVALTAVPAGVPVTTTVAKGGYSGQGADGANRGARADCEEGKAGRRLGVRGDGACGGANGYDDTHDALMGGGGGSLKGGDG